MTERDSARIVWELEQRRLIAETLMAYSHFIDRNDPEGLVTQVFREDGRFELGSRHAVVGRSDLVLLFAKTMAPFAQSSHHVSNIRIEFIDDETADSRAYVYAWHLTADDGRRVELWGRYHDRLRLTPDGWRIASRRLTVAGSEGWKDAPFELIERLPSPADLPSPKITRL